MSDLIKIRLSDNSEAALKGADYFVLEGNERVFYDSSGKELWREKDKTESSRSDNSEQ